MAESKHRLGDSSEASHVRFLERPEGGGGGKLMIQLHELSLLCWDARTQPKDRIGFKSLVYLVVS